jgi:hypothetical protein
VDLLLSRAQKILTYLQQQDTGELPIRQQTFVDLSTYAKASLIFAFQYPPRNEVERDLR